MNLIFGRDRAQLAVLILISTAFSGLVAFLQIGSSPDFFWHLRTGMDLVESGLSAYVDHYSYTHNGHAIRFASPVFDSLLYVFHNYVNGIFGVQLMMCLLLTLTLFIYTQIFKFDRLAFHLKIFGLLCLSTTFRMRNEPRPELLAFVFIGTAIYLYKLTANKSLRPKIYFAFAVLQLLWTNIHASSVLGYAIGGALYLSVALESQKNSQTNAKDWALWFFAGALTIAVGFINPTFHHVLLEHLSFSPDLWAKHIDEFLPIDIQFAAIPIQVFLTIGLLSVLISLARKKLADAILLVVFLQQAFSANRVAGLLPLIVVPFFLEHLSWLLRQDVRFLKQQISKTIYWSAYVIVGCLIAFYFFGTTVLSPLPYSADVNRIHQPYDVVEFMKKNKLAGRIRNEYGNGGFLLLQLFPQNRVFIDGRTHVLYSFDFFEKYASANHDRRLLKEEFEAYPADFVLARSTHPGFLLDTALETGKFSVAYSGVRYSLLTAGKSPFVVSSRSFAHPECLKKSDLEQLKLEFERAKAEMPPDSPLVEFLAIAVHFFEKDDLDHFHREIPVRSESPHVSRLIANLSIRKKRLPQAYYYLSLMRGLRRDDRLVMARLACDFNSCRGAEEALSYFQPEGVQGYEIAEAYDLLTEAHSKTPALHFDQERMERIKQSLEKYPSDVRTNRPDWCAI